MCEDIELTPEQVLRNDDIDNAVFQCICILVERPDLD